MLLRQIAGIGIALVVGGCVTYENPVPAGYTGPTATIGENAFSEDSTKAQIFYIESIDGKPVRSSFQQTRKATEGKGFGLSLDFASHTVPAKPLRLKLVGTHITGAPIHEFVSRAAGTFYSVKGEIEFLPEPGGKYFVTGKLSKEISSVWIADFDTEKPVSVVVNSSH